ncbi:MAG: FAD-dependent oxidoreductase [Blastocatellia bacterium]|nr:FAD-dependent oxidoreductase [Blastocatellia bacterium]MBK6427406.1 FAD-dependent oxidoreductase [Blastocatellia bacterium]
MASDPKLSDIVVVGAGFGGLAAAALLAKQGHSVVVLEAGGLPGGCGQTFRRGPYRFDAGATTICGAQGDMPLARLAAELEVDFGLSIVDPGMSIWLDDRRIDRHTDREAWIDEACRHFGASQRGFWEHLFRVADLGWRLARNADRFPPSNIRDLVRTVVGAGPDGLRLLPAFATSTARAMSRRLGTVSSRFARFVDEQLLITAQADAATVPLAVGAMGLTYTNFGNFTSPGGVGGLAETLVSAIRRYGGTVTYGHKVDLIEAADGRYRVRTRRGEYLARRVISNLTVWDMGQVGGGAIGEHFRCRRAARLPAWGAFTGYLAVRDTFGSDPALHHQVVFDEPLPVTGSSSVFVSISPRGDASRAPDGRRAVTISTHTDVVPWWDLDAAAHEDAKHRVLEAVIDRVTRFSGLGRFDVEAALAGSPRTFVRYTGRSMGRVGGIPSTFAALANASRPATPFAGLFVVGDTVFPGQGIPAVVLGALNVVTRIGESDKKLVIIDEHSSWPHPGAAL